MRRLLPLLLVIGLIAAACGSDQADTTSPAGEAGAGPTTSMDSTTTTSGATTSSSDGTTTTSSSDGEGTTTTSNSAPAPDQPLPDSEYPAVVVADLAGGDFNLKELVLEEEPVLLWFWAPH